MFSFGPHVQKRRVFSFCSKVSECAGTIRIYQPRSRRELRDQRQHVLRPGIKRLALFVQVIERRVVAFRDTLPRMVG